MASNGGFGNDLHAFRLKAGDQADKLIRGVCIKLFSAVIQDTPVGNPDLWQSPAPPGYVGGSLRAAWTCSLGHSETFPPVQSGAPRPGSYTIQNMTATVNTGDRNDVFWLSNALPYAQAIENGHSSQAPQGMVARNVARFKRIIAARLAAGNNSI